MASPNSLLQHSSPARLVREATLRRLVSAGVGSPKSAPLPKGLTFAFSHAEIKGIRQALDEVENSSHEVQAEGLSQFNFSLGIINVVLTTLVFGKWPQHLWVFYTVECVLLIPVWLYRMTTELKAGFYILDFCWATSCVFGLYMIATYFALIPESFKQTAFLVFYSCALGPMSWACIVLMSGLVFHSLNKTASLFIHFTPTLVAYTILHNAHEISEQWPGRFPSLEVLTPTMMHTYDAIGPEWWFYVDSVYLHGWCFYVCWWLLYGTWLLTVGVDLPPRYDTVFASIYESTNMGVILEQRTGLQNIRSHCAVYLLAHFAASSFAFFWSPAAFYGAAGLGSGGVVLGSIACFAGGLIVGGSSGFPMSGGIVGIAVGGTVGLWLTPYVIWIVVVFVCAVWIGAGHYEFLMAHKYTKVIQTMLEDLEGH